MLAIVITLFKVYFHLNTLQLCKNLINAVERLQFDAFPASSRVTYMFYLGRLHIFDNDYVSSESDPLSLTFLTLACRNILLARLQLLKAGLERRTSGL